MLLEELLLSLRERAQSWYSLRQVQKDCKLVVSDEVRRRLEEPVKLLVR
jgi:hypothetical protein